MRFGTQLIHNGNDIDEKTGALSIPIYQASTFHQSDIDKPPLFDYSRSGNPTRQALEDTMALLEGGDRGFAFASGMAATSSVLAIFEAGDHIVICEDVYGGTFRIMNTLFKRFHLESTFVDAGDPGNIKAAIKGNTRALFLETPSNPLMKITDLPAAIAMAREHNLLVIVDNTFMSPYLQCPLKLGADIVVHSATKFIGGHSDVVGGLAVVCGEQLARKVYAVQNGFGAILGPQDSWLLLRGLKTLKVRMDYQQDNAQKLAEWLLQQEQVEKVYYPGLQHHPGSEIHSRQSDGPGAVLAFKTRTTELARKFMNNVTLAAVAVSLGGVETIVSYPVTMSHASMPPAERSRLGITDSLIRVSLGLEDVLDLISDFRQAWS
ncbi:MAG TPA: PLP-dependent aspartate aminotransferase family protein [Syntrophomonadaceae bacterium]|nr:PLP-dependent aspartate aminotransferase family protein [Syntrophomonadaceae bacterium]